MKTQTTHPTGTLLARNARMQNPLHRRTLASISYATAAAVAISLCPFMAKANTTSSTRASSATVQETVRRIFEIAGIKKIATDGASEGATDPSSGEASRYEGMSRSIETFLKRQKGMLNGEKAQLIAEGAVGSGGGTGYRQRLLDLVLYHPHPNADLTPGQKLPVTPAFRKGSFDRLNSAELPVFQKAVAQVNKWLPSSPIMAPRILRALHAMPIYYAEGKISGPPIAFKIPPDREIDPKELYVIGVYAEKFGCFTSKERFEELPEFHQIAYFVKEALRHMQITHQTLIENDTLQRLTAQIMTEPRAGRTLDTATFMAGPILTRILKQQAAYLSALALGERGCALFKAGCGFAETPVEELLKALVDTASQLITSTASISDWNRVSREIAARRDLGSEMNHRASELITLGVDELLEGGVDAVYSVNRTIGVFGTLDWALHEVNTKFAYDRDALELLWTVKSILLSEGMMSAKGNRAPVP